MPGSPFQLRDLVQQLAVGFLVLALAAFSSWHFGLAAWAGLGRGIDGQVLRETSAGMALLLLPTGLLLLYVLGAVAPNPYAVLAKTGGLMQRGMLAARILERQEAPSVALLRPRSSAVQAWRGERIAGLFGVRPQELAPGELEDLFRAMAARVMSREAGLAQLDIERHSSLALFNARLSVLLFLFLVASLIGLLGKLLAAAGVPAAGGGAPAPLLALLAAGSYVASSACGRRAQGIYRQWHRLVLDACVALPEEEAAAPRGPRQES